MNRASYRAALDWIARNDDCEWLKNGDPISVTAAMVADLFDLDEDKVRHDLQRTHGRIWK